MDNNITPLNIRSLFSQGKYAIPIYQRNYAWGNKEIIQLIQDIVDYASKDNVDEKAVPYYIGSLIVYERKEDRVTIFETIDGQQRLTTLNILLSVLKREYSQKFDLKDWFELNLEFDSRQVSTDTLQAIFSDTKVIPYQDFRSYNTAIQQAYADAHKALKKIIGENKITIEKFYSYLINNVYILRVPVPHDTDLNHYFEIMNSRGEQLEKHEVLKAYMLKEIKDDRELSYAFHLIWEACADMERYVQYGFSVEQRSALFKERDWNTLQYDNLESISKMFSSLKITDEDVEGEELSIDAIIEYKGAFEQPKRQKEDAPDRFNTVINFSNFLLHVLRVQTESDVSLDDKRLLEIFDPYLKGDKVKVQEFVKTFGYNLLKCKFLFDKYIIKREFLKDKDQWSLKRLKWYDGNNVSYINTFGDENESDGENKKILMILSMFHVSAPTLVYKHWLNAALKYVFEREQVSASYYLTHLESLAKAYLFDRFLAKTPQDYFDIIYKNNGSPTGVNICEEALDDGVNVENFIFNYLDYLLWKKEPIKYNDFEFTFSSSVEHYYPQNPLPGIKPMHPDLLHSFGNLCLISGSKNSKLNNHLPKAKKDYYLEAGTDSIKQRLMMEKENWWDDEVIEHSKAMKQILLSESINLN
ncbi:DUF262 domain-containing protein [Pontibacter chinhatensis]|uniref:DUF262 domain-containing protein n=1 Tax=Pontibacter chinhatensis TaxID=1436961 RepID=A0A1I2QMK3_9BACT|nr:DUF262 domain-containing protein [Pontibacter chinhatensis]SFG29825.1 Protein of unknown function [Pontibacter chinhatensis]